VNIEIEGSLMVPEVSHIAVTDIPSIVS